MQCNTLVIVITTLVFCTESFQSIRCNLHLKRSDEQNASKLYDQDEKSDDTFDQSINDERRCQPILSNLSLSNKNKNTSSTRSGITFPMNDIYMPLEVQQGAGHPIQSAMNLLSIFEKQIYGEEDDEPEAEVEDEDEHKSNTIQFKQNKLFLSGLNLTILNVHLYNQSDPKFGLGINIKNTTLYGQFHYNGPAPTLLASGFSSASNSPTGQQSQSSTRSGRSKLSGNYRMSIDNVLVIANSNLSKTPVQEDNSPGYSGSKKALPTKNFKFVTNDFRMAINNLGYISIDIFDAEDPTKPTSNYLLKMLQRVLQKTIKRIYYSFEKDLMQTMEDQGRRFLDCELTRFGTTSVAAESNRKQEAHKQLAPKLAVENEEPNKLATTTSLEDLSNIVSAEITKLNLSTVSLPDFEHQRQLFGTGATIYFTNGSLSGLNNFRLSGETKVKLQNEHLLVNASLGWFNLRPHYNWTLFMGINEPSNKVQTAGTGTSTKDEKSQSTTTMRPRSSPLSSGFVAFNIRAIDFDAVIRKGLVSGSKVLVDEFTISGLDAPKMEFGGLPGMNRLTRGLVNFFMGRLKNRLVTSLQPSLKRELELVLNRLPLLNQI